MNTPHAFHRRAQAAARPAWKLRPVCLAICLLGLHGGVQALPQGGQVVQGQAGIQTATPGRMDIQQSTQKAVINWQGFSIAPGEVVQIQQPGASSVLLNRVTGIDPSLIEGRLQANGQVFLLNPRGVVFGQGSQIDVGGFLGSTLGLSDSQFMGGHYSLAAGPEAPGALQADGHIAAPGGTVALVAPQLSVGGRINAARVGLAAAGSALVDVEGDGLVLFNVRSEQLDTRLNFNGRIQADGGSAELRAQARAGFADTVLNLDGIVQARSLGQREGRIVVDGGTAGITQLSGTLDATGAQAGERGGSVTVLGDQLGLFGTALVDVSGQAGGGSAWVGGGFHGVGTGHNAQHTVLGAQAQVRADALASGDGGQVAVWADDRTDVYGRISARGGPQGGAGGSVETSGRQVLNMPMGSVDVGAPQGLAGRWLLDPNNLTITATGSADSGLTTAGGPPPDSFTASANSATLSVDSLKTALVNGANVTVTTVGTTGTQNQAGDITVAAPITTSLAAAQNASLTLSAARNISFTNGGTAASTGGIAAGAGSLTVTLNAGASASGVSMEAGTAISTGGGNLSVNATGPVMLGQVNAGDLTVHTSGTVHLGNSTLTGALGVTSGGLIDQTGTLHVTGITTLDAGTADINLASANSLGGNVSATGAGITLKATGALNLGTLSPQTGHNVLVEASSLGLPASAIATGAGDLSLSSLTGTLTTNGNLSGQNLTLVGAGGLSLGHNITAQGTLTLTATDAAIAQTAGRIVATGAADVQAGTGAVTLDRAQNDFQSTLALGGGLSQVTDTNALSLGLVQTSGNLTLISGGTLNLGHGQVGGALQATSNHNAIVQDGVAGLVVTGNATLDAGAGANAGNITLAQAGNDIAGTVTLTGAAVDLRVDHGLSLLARTQTANQALTLSAGTTLTLPAGAIDTGTADLSLASLGGSLVPAGALSGHNVSLTGAAGISLGQNVTAQADLNLTTTHQAIVQTAGNLVVGASGTGASHVNAGNGAITLTQAGNNFQTAVDLSGGTTAITDAGALTLGTLATGSLNASSGGALNLGHGQVAGTLLANSGGNTISQGNAALVVTGNATLNAGSASINLPQTGNDFGGNTSLTGGAITLKASNTLAVTGLTQNGANQALVLQADTLQLPAGFSVDTGNASLSLRSLVGPLATAGTLAGQDVTLQGGTGLSLDHAITARGQLTLASGSGPITQTAALSVAGTTQVNAGSGAITLTQAGNGFGGAVDLSGGATQIASAGVLTLGTLATGNLAATASGALGLGQGTVGGTLSANSSGNAITQTGALSVAGVANVNAGAGSITLTDAGNHFQAAVNLTGAGTQITDTNALTLGTLATGNLNANASGTLNLGQGTVTGTLSANSHGGLITQSGALSVTGAATVQAGAGSIALTDTGNDFQGLVNLSNTAGAQISNAHALTLGSLATGNLSATASGALGLGQGTVAGTLAASSGGNTITQTGALSVSGVASINAGAGSITLTDAGNHFQAAVNLTGAGTQITDANALTLGTLATGGLVANASGALNLGQGTVTGTLSANSHGGPIGQTGNLVVSGAASLDAGSGAVTLTQAGNDFQGAVTLTGAATQLTDANALTLGNWSVGSLTANATGALGLGSGSASAALVVHSHGGDINQAGALSVAGPAQFNAGSGSITLTQAGNALGGVVSLSGGTTQIANAQALSLGTLGTGALSVDAQGPLVLGHGSVAGTLDANSHGHAIGQAGGGLTVTGLATLNAGAGSIALTDAGNDFQSTVQLVGASLQITDANALSLGPVSTGSLVANATGDLSLAAATVSGDFSAHSHGGAITQAGALSVGGSATLAAGSGNITLANAGNDFQGAVSLSGGTAQLVDANALTLGTLATGHLTASAHGALNLGQGSVAGTLSADSQGYAITQASGGLSVSGTATLTAGAASITLDQPTNQFQSAVHLTGGTTRIANGGALSLGLLSTGALSVAAAGNLDLGQGTVAGTLDASSQGSAITQAGPLVVAGSATLTADGHALQATLDQAGNQFGGGVVLAGSHGGAIATATVHSAQALSVAGSADTLNASSGSLLTLGAGQYASLNATAAGGVVQSGALAVSGTTTLVANGSSGMAATLDHAGNDLHAVQLQAQNGGSLGTVRVVDGDGLRADGLRVAGDAADLILSSTGPLSLGGGHYASLAADTSAQGAAITQTGALSVSGATRLNSGTGDIVLNLAGNDLNSLAITATRAASVQDANDLMVQAVQASQQLALGAPGAIHLAGPFSGTGALVMDGSGSLLIASAHTYSGGTQANAGSVVLDGAAAQAGSGTVVLGAGGRLDLRQGATLANPLLAQGGRLANTAGAGSVSGPVTLAADTAMDVAASAAGLSLAGAVGETGGPHGLALAGGGVLTLAGSNGYSGATQVHAGTLVALGSGALPAASAVTVDAGATLQLAQSQAVGSLAGSGQVDLQGFDLATGLDNTSTTYSGSLLGSGGLAKLGSGSFTLSGTNTATGATQVSAGRLVLAGGAALADSSAVTVAAGATLQLASDETIGSLAGAGSVDLQAQRLSTGANHASTEFAGTLVGSGGLAKLGNGSFTLSGSNRYGGDTLVQAGSLRLAQTHAQADTTAMNIAAGATLDLQSDAQVGALSGAGQVQLNGHTLSTGANGSDSAFSGSLGGSGALVKTGAGNLALSGTNSYTGATTLAAGTLTLSGGSALADSTAVSVASGARLVVAGDETLGSLAGAGEVALAGHSLATGADGSSTRYDGVISGTGGLTKLGSGSFTLAGANGYSGGTQILAGTLRVGDGATHGQLGSGAVDNRAALVFDRSDAITVDNAITGSGSLTQLQGQLTLTSTANQYTGATTVSGGTLATSGAERLPDGSAVQVAAGAQLQLAGSETLASVHADGAVRAAGDIRTSGDQAYAGPLTLSNPQGSRLSGQQITAVHGANQFGSGPLSIQAASVQIAAPQNLVLGDVSLSGGGQISADRLALNGTLVLSGGHLGLVATATPDTALASPQGNAQVPLAGKALAVAEATVQQGPAGRIDVASGASLDVAASGGGSVRLAQDANRFAGSLSVLSGPQFNTAWLPNVQGTVGVQSLVDVAGSLVVVGGAGIEADLVHIRADQLSTAGSAQMAARLPFDEFLLGTSLSAPSMTLELAPAAFQQAGSFGQSGGQELRVAVGARDIGGRTDGPNAGFLTIRPKGGAQGATAVFLVGPPAAIQVGGYRFFHDGAGQQTEVPVFYNGVLPMTPQATGALSSIDGDAEDARRARFQETVRTENVTLRLRAGVIAEVGPGRPATQGSDGATPPPACEPDSAKGLTCQ